MESNHYNQSSTIAEKKKALRQEVHKLKKEQANTLYLERSRAIMLKIEQLPEFARATTILAYWSFDGEVFTHDAIIKWSASKRVILPSVDGDVMNLKLFTDVKQLVPGDRYAIPEPGGDIFNSIDEIELIIVPGMAFDRFNNRMGRGKAYYDRFLLSTSSYKAGVCFSFQLFDSVPVDQFDQRMDIVITD